MPMHKLYINRLIPALKKHLRRLQSIWMMQQIILDKESVPSSIQMISVQSFSQMRPSAPKLLRLHMSFSQPKQAAAKQQHKIKDKNGVTRIYSKRTATGTPRVLSAGVGGHDMLCRPEAVKIYFKIPQECVT